MCNHGQNEGWWASLKQQKHAFSWKHINKQQQPVIKNNLKCIPFQPTWAGPESKIHEQFCVFEETEATRLFFRVFFFPKHSEISCNISLLCSDFFLFSFLCFLIWRDIFKKLHVLWKAKSYVILLNTTTTTMLTPILIKSAVCNSVTNNLLSRDNCFLAFQHSAKPKMRSNGF